MMTRNRDFGIVCERVIKPKEQMMIKREYRIALLLSNDTEGRVQ